MTNRRFRQLMEEYIMSCADISQYVINAEVTKKQRFPRLRIALSACVAVVVLTLVIVLPVCLVGGKANDTTDLETILAGEGYYANIVGGIDGYRAIPIVNIADLEEVLGREIPLLNRDYAKLRLFKILDSEGREIGAELGYSLDDGTIGVVMLTEPADASAPIFDLQAMSETEYNGITVKYAEEATDSGVKTYIEFVTDTAYYIRVIGKNGVSATEILGELQIL